MAPPSDIELEKMVRGFRVTDLQTLLGFAGRNKVGKKVELQRRALELVKLNRTQITLKICELHRSRNGQVSAHTDHSSMYPMPHMSNSMMGYNSRSSHHMSGPPMYGGYVPNSAKHILPPAAHMNMLSQYPMNPDVKFKELPFYDVLAELLKPMSIPSVSNERFPESISFFFTPQQLSDLQKGVDVLVQVRFCVLDTSCEQDDEIPATLSLKVNMQTCNLPNVIPTNKPGAELKRPRHPVDITPLIIRTAHEANVIHISWTSSTSTPYVIGIYLVQKQNSAVLLRRLKDNGVRNPDHTTAMIKEKLSQDRDSEIATMSLRGSLICPLGKIKMLLPCRAVTCSHLQCFDAGLYLQMNEKKPKWICPVCDKPAYFKKLAIDGLFLDITLKVPDDCTEVQFHEDGSWTPVLPVKKPEVSEAAIDTPPKNVAKVDKSKPKKPIEIISLDSDSDTEEDPWPNLPPKKKVYKPSSENSPVLLESPENTQTSEDVPLKTTFDPFSPSSVKSDGHNASKLIPNIPTKASLPPLPESLDIDTNDVECILGIVQSPAKGSSTSRYENISPASSPSPYCPPSSGFNESVEVLMYPATEGKSNGEKSGKSSPKMYNPPSENSFPETAEVRGNSHSSNRTFSNFDLFTLIQEDNQEENFFPPAMEEEDSPDVINID